MPIKLEQDKQQHFVVGLAISAVVAAAFSISLALGLGATATVAVLFGAYMGQLAAGVAGWLKERYDLARPAYHTFDGWDAFATWAGGALVSSVIVIGLVLQRLAFS